MRAADFRRGLFGRALAAAALAALGACAARPDVPLETITSAPSTATSPEERLRGLLADEQRLNNVFGRLATSNVELCGAQFVPSFGFRLWSIDDFEPANRAAAGAAFGLTERLQVYAVAAGQPAEAAGIAPGDVLTRIEGRAVEPGEAGRRQYSEGVTAGLLKRGRVSFTFERDGKARKVRLNALKACPYAVALAIGEEPNAATDGKTIFVSSGMMAFARDDQDLAIVLGHELAHAIRNHPMRGASDAVPPRSTAGRVVGAVVDVAAGIGGAAYSVIGGMPQSRRNSIAFEKEADYVGLYLAARAGYDVSYAARIWRRLDEKYGASSSDHPTSDDRFEAMTATSAEIAEKRAAGEPLVPAGLPSS